MLILVTLCGPSAILALRSIGLSPKIRKIIEGGPPSMLADNFEKLFRTKIDDTSKAARAARAALGWK